MCGDYQQMVYRFCYQDRENYWGLQTISHLQRCVLQQLGHQKGPKRYLGAKCPDQQLQLHKGKEKKDSSLYKDYKIGLKL